MEKYLELIWKKLDGDISPVELNTFNDLYKTDSSFLELFETQSKLNNSLRKLPVHTAPEALIDNVMLSVDKPTLSSKYSSFSALKFFNISLLVITALSCLLYFWNTDIKFGESSFTIFDNLSDAILSSLVIPEALQSYLPYSLALLAITVLVWMDNLLKQRVFNYTAVL